MGAWVTREPEWWFQAPGPIHPLPASTAAYSLCRETHSTSLKLKQHTQAFHIEALITPYLFISTDPYCLTHSSHTLHLHTLVCPHSPTGLPWWVRQSRICLQCGRPRFSPWVGKVPWRRKWQPTPVFVPGESHGQRSLVGYSPWGPKRVGND